MENLPAKLEDKITWNIMCTYVIGPYQIHRKGKYPLILTFVTIIDPVIPSFEVVQYYDRKYVAILHLVQTKWLSAYPWKFYITYG